MSEQIPVRTPVPVAPESAPSTSAPSTPAPSSTYRQELSRSLTMRENILITLSSVTPASSVFIIVPAVVLGVGAASVLTFLIAAVAALFVAFCYAELSATYPVTGGEYTWAARLLGKPVGFAVFLLSLVSGVLIIGVIALGTGEYLGVAFSSLSGKWVGVAVIVVTAFVAALNIRTNAWVTGVFLAIEVAAVIVLTVLGVFHLHRGPGAFLHPQTFDGHGLTSVGAGTLVSLVPVALFAYNGYGAAVYYVEETKNATKTIGRVILASLVATVVIELVPLAAVILGAPSLKDMLASGAPMTYFLTTVGGSWLNTAVSIGIAIAIINAVIAIIIQIARLLYASARDQSWPGPVDRFLGVVHPRFKTPVNATLVVGLVAALCATFVPFSWLLTATGASVVVIYVVVAAAALRLRKPGRPGSRGYTMRWWPLPPLLLIGLMVYVTYTVVRDSWSQLAVAVVTMVVGVAYYYGFIHPRRGERWTLPDPIHDDEIAG